MCYAGEFDPEFQGMHRIERMLYRDGITSGANNFTTKTLNEWALQVQEVYESLGTKIDAVRPQAVCHNMHTPQLTSLYVLSFVTGSLGVHLLV